MLEVAPEQTMALAIHLLVVLAVAVLPLQVQAHLQQERQTLAAAVQVAGNL
jgi:hypothetical protein